MFWAKRINPGLFSLAYIGQSSHSELIALPRTLGQNERSEFCPKTRINAI